METKILVVDDEQDILDLISYNLSKEGFKVYTATNGTQAVEVARKVLPDLIILDVMMPGMDGFAVLRELRKQSEVPVLMLTALGEEADRIVGLEIGADDYLPKTFSSRELLARVRAVIRRSRLSNETTLAKEWVVGPLRVCEATHCAVLDDQLLDLTTLEFAILCSLMKSRGRVKSREQLVEEVSERRFDVFDRSIDVHVSSLRRKLGDDAKHPRLIHTIRGIGYVLREPDSPAVT